MHFKMNYSGNNAKAYAWATSKWMQMYLIYKYLDGSIPEYLHVEKLIRSLLHMRNTFIWFLRADISHVIIVAWFSTLVIWSDCKCFHWSTVSYTYIDRCLNHNHTKWSMSADQVWILSNTLYLVRIWDFEADEEAQKLDWNIESNFFISLYLWIAHETRTDSIFVSRWVWWEIFLHLLWNRRIRFQLTFGLYFE